MGGIDTPQKMGDKDLKYPIRVAAAAGMWPVAEALRSAKYKSSIDNKGIRDNQRTIWHDIATPDLHAPHGRQIVIHSEDSIQIDWAESLCKSPARLLCLEKDKSGRLPLHYAAQ